ncbi:MAG: DUF2252 family protein [Aeromicrobium sp.]
MADARALTSEYERWLGGQIPLDAGELDRKHQEMAADEIRFLRATYYLWLARVAEHAPRVLDMAAVPLVGDLHVQNFGTWRDHEQIRRWGVNDLDELGRGPWLLDLLRLAVSAVLAPDIALDEAAVCAAILDAWRATTPRAALEVTERGAEHLERLIPSFDSPAKFYADLAKGPQVKIPPAVAAAAAGVAEAGWTPVWHQHVAGTGSLGHARAVGVGPAADGSMHAREAKQLGPGAATWAAGRHPRMPIAEAGLYDSVMRAVRGAAGATRVGDWQVRDLAPDVVRIELSGLHAKNAARLLRSMARAAADVHGSDPSAFAAARADPLTAAEFAAMVHAMVDVTKADWQSYR